jgi:hypothetical protein
MSSLSSPSSSEFGSSFSPSAKPASSPRRRSLRYERGVQRGPRLFARSRRFERVQASNAATLNVFEVARYQSQAMSLGRRG